MITACKFMTFEKNCNLFFDEEVSSICSSHNKKLIRFAENNLAGFTVKYYLVAEVNEKPYYTLILRKSENNRVSDKDKSSKSLSDWQHTFLHLFQRERTEISRRNVRERIKTVRATASRFTDDISLANAMFDRIFTGKVTPMTLRYIIEDWFCK